jgi:hypothetical protein
MSTIVTRAGKGSPLTNNEVDSNFTNLNTDKVESITSADGSVVVSSSGTTRDLSVGVAGSTATLISQVRNETGATLTKGTVVYISGAAGNKAVVSKALATGDSTSAQTYGMVQADIPHNQNGYVVVVGAVSGLNTSAFADGTQLYLSGVSAGGYTNTKPYAPTHLVYVGIVTYSHNTQGTIQVKIQNGYELDEIHDVSARSPVDGQTLVYVSSTGLWTKTDQASMSVGSAATLATARNINGVSFNGSADITVADATKLPLAGGTLSGKLTLDGRNEIYGVPTNAGTVAGFMGGTSGGTTAARTQSLNTQTLLNVAALGYTGSGWVGGAGLSFVATENITAANRGTKAVLTAIAAGDSVATTMEFNGSALTINGSTAVTSSNYNTYAPTKTGTGASGTWAINITGNAATATSATDSTKLPLAGGTLTGNVTLDTSDGEILVTPTGWRSSDRAAIKIRSKANAPAEIDLRHTVSGVESGWHISARDTSSASELHFYRFNMNSAGAADSAGSFLQMFTFRADGSFNTAGAITQNGSQVLTAGNYNSYSPTLTGTGASGTWGISISGNAATVTNGLYKVGTNAIPAAVVLNTTADNWMWQWASSGSNDWYLGPTTANFGIGGSRLAISSSGSSPNAELSIERGTTRLLEILQANLQYKSNVVLHAGNYNSYSPTLTGTGASGTWGISISGNSATTSQRAFSGDISATGQGRFTGWYTGNAATGTAAEIGMSSGEGYVFVYNRDTQTYGTLNISSSGANMRFSGSAINVGSGSLQQGGNQVLHAGNYTSYAATSGHNHTYDVNNAWLRDANDDANVKLYGNTRQMVFRTDGTTEFASGIGGYAFAWMYGGDSAAERRMLLASNGRLWTNYHGWMDDAFAPLSHTHSYLPLSGGTLSGSIYFPNDSANGIFNAAGNAGYRPDDVYGNTYMFNQSGTNGGWYGDFSGYYFRSSSSSNWLTISGSAVNSSVALQQSGNQVLHAGNYNSYSPTLGGSGASGTWGINITGTASLATNAIRIQYNDGPRDLSDRLPNSFTRTVNFDFVGAGTGNGSGNYAGVMTYSPWTGTTASTGDSSYQLAFANASGVNASGQPRLSIRNGIDSTWNSWYILLHAGNYTSYSPSLTGSGASGTWGISITGNAATAGGLAVHNTQSTQNSANQIVRTQDNGYTMLGWINTTSGDSGIANRLTRIYSSYDEYVRYSTLTDFKVHMGLSAKNNYSRRIDYTSDANYHVGSMGHSGYGANETFHGGSGFFDIWSGTNYPPSTSHIHGFNALHYTTNSLGSTGGNAYGIQVAGQYDQGGLLFSRGCSGGSFTSWRRQIDDNNYSSYALPLSGGTLTGLLTVNHFGNGSPSITVNSGGSENWRAISVRAAAGGDNFGIGYSNTGHSVFGRNNLSFHCGAADSVRFHSDGWDTLWEVTGSGGDGWLKGKLGVGVVADLRLSVNGDSHISGVLHMGGTAGSYNSWGSRDYTTSGSRYTNANYFEVNNYGYGSTWTFALDNSSARYKSNAILHAGNYTSYSPSLSGSGASGTWAINVTGSSGITNVMGSSGYGNGTHTWRQDSGTFAGYSGWASYLISNHGDGDTYYSQTIIMPFWSAPQYSRKQGSSAVVGPYTFLTTENYTSYSPTLTGGSASGTWGIAISGNAARATRANGNFYIDDNYGNGVVGVYSSYRYQTVYAMGDSYKMSADGTSLSNMYGIAWSHPNAGGAAGNLTDHGLLIINAGGFRCAISNSIVASANITAYSDERLKTNWRDMPEDYVARLAKVKVGIYDRTDQEDVTQVGVSAQSFQNLLPQAIMTAKDEMQTLSVSYGNAALASAVELAKDNVELRARIERLESLINKLIGD